jgi:hypothetical protein
MYADYGAAAVWTLYSLQCIGVDNISTCMALEGTVFFLNVLVSSRCDQESYKFAHSIWHIASAAKCLWISCLLKAAA